MVGQFTISIHFSFKIDNSFARLAEIEFERRNTYLRNKAIFNMYKGFHSAPKHCYSTFSPHDSEIVYLKGLDDDLTDELVRRNLSRLKDIASNLRADIYDGRILSYIPECLEKDFVERNHYFAPGHNARLTQDSSNYFYEYFRYQIFGNNIAPEQGVFLVYDSVEEIFYYQAVNATNDNELLSYFESFCNALPEVDYDMASSTIIPDRPYDTDETFVDEIEHIEHTIRESISQLRGYGVEEAIIQALFLPQQKLSRLVLTKDYRIILPDYDNLEIKMEPLPKAIYILFLRHPEGLMFKRLNEHYDELASIYRMVTNREDISEAESSLKRLIDPYDNSINEKCCRIKEAFISKFDDAMAKHYYISGKKGTPKGIIIDRAYVDDQAE